MGVRGIDISNHQAGMDVERVVRENNIGFTFILSNDGTFKNSFYAGQAAAARRGGSEVVPYIYLRTNVRQTFDTFRAQVPEAGPVIVDVEDGSGGVAECRMMHDLLHEAGYTTPLLYWPDWYRRKVGGPSLVGFPPLWTSWYPDYVNRGFDQGLAMLPSWVWNGYGGLSTAIVQFTSSGRLSGYSGNLDLNYYPGTRDELARLLGGSQEGDDVSAEDFWNYEIENPVTGDRAMAKDFLRYICAENMGPLVWSHKADGASEDMGSVVTNLQLGGVDIDALAQAIGAQVAGQFATVLHNMLNNTQLVHKDSTQEGGQ